MSKTLAADAATRPPKPRKSRSTRIIHGVGSTFIALGLVILYFVFYELVGTSLQTHAHQSKLKQEFAQELDHAPVGPNLATPTPGTTPTNKGVHGIAELIIPKIHLDEIVVEGVTLGDLAYGPGHYPDSAPIGGAGSTAIAGHRTGWGSPFYNLDALTTGDIVILKSVSGTFTYRVTRGDYVVAPTDYQVIRGDPNSTATHKLTLTTCTPRYTSRNRLIVWGDLISTQPRAA